MGYQGGKLTDLFSTVPAKEASEDMADQGGEHLIDRAKAHTPVKGGKTRDAWRRSKVKRRGDVYRVDVENPHYIAWFLEHGTDPHKVGPKGEKAISTPEGPRASAEVDGIQPVHMMGKASAETEAAADAITRPALERWAREQEALAKRHLGIS